MSSSYKTILFDADGTLFDYAYAERSALEQLCLEFDLPFSPELAQEYKRINSALWLQLERGEIDTKLLRVKRFDELMKSLSRECDAESLSTRYIHFLSLGTQLLPEAERVCSVISQSCSLVMLTNGFANVQRPRVSASSLASYFSEIVISEEVGISKPDKRIFEHALEKVGADPTSTLMVGDNLTADIQGGANAGLDTCWVNFHGALRGEVQPTYEISALSELLPIIAV
jgi:2-haloacid dehalogenase